MWKREVFQAWEQFAWNKCYPGYVLLYETGFTRQFSAKESSAMKKKWLLPLLGLTLALTRVSAVAAFALSNGGSDNDD